MEAPGPEGAALHETIQALRQEPLDTLLTLQRQFGDVVCLRTSPSPVYLLSHPDAVQHVLYDRAAQYRKGILFQGVAALQGQGLLTSAGALWQQQRRMLRPPLHPRQLARLGPLIQAEIHAVVQAWQQAAESGTPVQVSAWMQRFAFRVMGRVLLGLPSALLDELGQQLQPLGAQLLPYLSQPWLSPSGHFQTPKPPAAIRQAIAAYQALAQQIIDARRQTLQDSQATDLLATLLLAQERTGELSDQHIRDEIITFIGAGTETAAQALSWLCYLLAMHPQIAQRVHAEIRRVVGPRPPTVEDLPELSYSRMVLHETLRLYPPAALIPRQANSLDTLSGYVLPPDSVVLLSPYVTHRHPTFWPVPHSFQPERFGATAGRHRHRCAFLPFGAGPRRCIGQPLAILEMHLAVSALLQMYTFALPSSTPIRPEFATTLRPRNGLWLTVQYWP